MCIVRRRSTKLIVWNRGAQAGICGTGREILKLSAPAKVSDHDVKLAVRAEPQHATIVVAPLDLSFVALSGRVSSSVLLEGAQLEQVLCERQRISVPGIAIDAIA